MEMLLYMCLTLGYWKVTSGDTVILRPDFVWKGDTFSVTCSTAPSLTESTMVLLRNGKYLETEEFTMTLRRGTIQPVSKVTSDQLIATKNTSSFIDADIYSCYTCYGTGHTHCPEEAEFVETSTASILVGIFEPDIEQYYVAVPNGFNLTMTFTGPGNMSSVSWLWYAYDVYRRGFREEHGFFEENGFTMEYYRMVATQTIIQDYGQYQFSFRRRITEGRLSDVASKDRSIDIITYGMDVTGPDKVAVGSDTALYCKIVDPNSAVLKPQLHGHSFHWKIQGQPVEKNDNLKKRILLTSAKLTSNLTIAYSDWKVSGKYTCVYSFMTADGRLHTMQQSVEVNGDPHIDGIQGNTSYDSEDNLDLRCLVGGYPAPEVTWYKDDQEIRESPNTRIVSDEEAREYRLVIENLKGTDTGNYSCRASGPNAVVDKTVAVEVDVGVGVNKKQLNWTYLIVGLVVGFSLFLIIIVCCCICCCKRRNKNKNVQSVYLPRHSQDSGFAESPNEEIVFTKKLKSILKSQKKINLKKVQMETKDVQTDISAVPQHDSSIQATHKHLKVPTIEISAPRENEKETQSTLPIANMQDSNVTEISTTQTESPLEPIKSKVTFKTKIEEITRKTSDTSTIIDENISDEIRRPTRRGPFVLHKRKQLPQQLKALRVKPMTRKRKADTLWSSVWKQGEKIPNATIFPEHKLSDIEQNKTDAGHTILRPNNNIDSLWSGINKPKGSVRRLTLLRGAPRAVLSNEPVYYRPYWRDGHGWDFSTQYGDFSQEVKQTTHSWDAA